MDDETPNEGSRHLIRLTALGTILLYWSTWNWIAVLCAPVVSQWFDIVLSAWISLVVSTWLWFVYPGRVQLYDAVTGSVHRLEIDSTELLVLHAAAHVLPLLLALAWRTRLPAPPATASVATVLALVVYVAVAPIESLYGMTKLEMLTVGTVALVALYCLVRVRAPGAFERTKRGIPVRP